MYFATDNRLPGIIYSSFVTFSAVSEAENAVEKLNNYEIDGRRIKVEMDDKENMMKQGCRIASKESSSNQIKIVFWPASLNEVGKFKSLNCYV